MTTNVTTDRMKRSYSMVHRQRPGLRALRAGSQSRFGVLVGALVLVAGAACSHAQVIQTWTNSAAFGDASGAAAVGDTLMFVNTNEDEVLRLYSRYPGSACRAAIYSLNVRTSLAPTGSDLTADLEACVKLVDASGTRIYWLGSHGNSTGGNLRPNRNRLFATQVLGDGTGSPPYTLTYVGRYDRLRDDILAWDAGNLHGLGANYFGLTASAAAGVGSKLINGFNIEGIAIGPDGTTAYIGFRAPFVDGSGPTTPTSLRTHALIIPLLNMPALVAGNPTPGPGLAQFGAPIVLALGSRGIRSIDCTAAGNYLITAGPFDNTSNPPAAPLDFRLFFWAGDPLHTPVERATTFANGYSPEACILPPGPISESTVAQFINDDGGNTCWRSMTCPVGGPAGTLDVPAVPGASRRPVFSSPPAPNPARRRVSFAITLPRREWVEITVHDVEGRGLATLWSGTLGEGPHEFSWDSAPTTGRGRPAGLYWVRLRARDGADARPFTLIH